MRKTTATAESLKLNDAIESVVVLKAAPTGGFEPVEVYLPAGVSKNTSKRMRGVEKIVDRMVRAESKMLDEYSTRHHASAAKKKNGWLKDFGKNVSKSMKIGRKELKLKSVF